MSGRRLLREDSPSVKAIEKAEEILTAAGIHIWSPGVLFFEIKGQRFTCEDLDMGSQESQFPRLTEGERFVLFN